MTRGTETIEQLECSIASAQGVLDNAQRVLQFAERAGDRAESTGLRLRRTVLVGVLISGVLAIFLLARHRGQL